MAEAVINIVVGKLDNIIEKKMELLGGVGKKVQRVRRELIRIQCCQRYADLKPKRDARVQNWLNDLHDVACRIEDATDMFLLEVENNHQEDPSFNKKLKKLFGKAFGQQQIIHKFGIELNHILHGLQEINKGRVLYGIQLTEISACDEVIIPYRRAVYQEVDETEVVGRQADKNNIMKLMYPEETTRRAVITIVGMGGVGKTTLASMIYKSAKVDFDYHIMLSISQQFSLSDLLRKMIRKYKQYAPENQDVEDLIVNLKTFLSSRRYLIVLDDVWEVVLWNQLEYALPDVKNGSRVLMTSRSMKVAQSSNSRIIPYELNFLDDAKSLDLLLEKALPYQETHKEYPNDLLELATQLSKKCKGLPLFLTVLGGILSRKEPHYDAWARVLHTINWHSDGKPCMDVLAMSYDHMPYYLKACFLYVASFPEDSEIYAKRLIKMWVAEGLISSDEWTTLEQRAEVYLEELCGRSMIQVSCRSKNGSIKRFYVHGLLRNLGMKEAETQNFVMVFSQVSDVKNPNRRIRRASLHAQERNPQFIEYVGETTRSLLLFGCEWLDKILECANFRLLRVLELVGDKDNLPMVTSFGLNSLDELIHLKYMGFRNCSIGILPCSFNRMKTLETLDVRGTGAKLPNALWTISTLRHVLCDPYNVRGALDGPTSASDLTNLQTLRWIQPLKTWDRELPLLENLRKLGVCEVGNWVTMTNLLETMPSLISLGIKAGHDECLPLDIIYPKAIPNYNNLQSLNLEGKWSNTVTLEASLFPPYLVKLTLINSQLEQNPMSELGKLKSLKKLCLDRKVLCYSGPTICSEGFPVLQHLQVTDCIINDLMVSHGVMPKLTYLVVEKTIHLDLPPELQPVIVFKQ